MKILIVLLIAGLGNCAAVATASAISQTETVRALVQIAESKQYADKRMEQYNGVPPEKQGDNSTWNNGGQAEYGSTQTVTYSGTTTGQRK